MALYPEIIPYEHGMLGVGHENLIYWEVCGNPDGKPVVVLHGGPGSGCTGGMRRFFDPAAYRIILFDQRNCGRSKPHASDPSTDLTTNTTEYLLADMEQLRQHLNVERWMVFGGSWGSTLALAYAEQHHQRVTEIILWGTAMTRKTEIDWLYRGVAPMFPEQWVRFRAGVSEKERDGDLVEAYYRLLHDDDPVVRAKAAKDWHDWEFGMLSIDPDAKPSPRWLEPDFQMARARIITHYFYHQAWLDDGILLREAGCLSGIPVIMVHGRLDLGSPLISAWELHQALPDSELIIVNDAGHSSGDPGMTEALVEATGRFARTDW